jgi:hypothetical protein
MPTRAAVAPHSAPIGATLLLAGRPLTTRAGMTRWRPLPSTPVTREWGEPGRRWSEGEPPPAGRRGVMGVFSFARLANTPTNSGRF